MIADGVHVKSGYETDDNGRFCGRQRPNGLTARRSADPGDEHTHVDREPGVAIQSHPQIHRPTRAHIRRRVHVDADIHVVEAAATEKRAVEPGEPQVRFGLQRRDEHARSVRDGARPG